MRNQSSQRCMPPRGLQIDSGGGSDGTSAILRKTLRITAAQYLVGSGTVGAQTVRFNVHNPSPRLRCTLSVGWELVGSADFVAGAGAPTWQLQAVRRSQEGGAQALLNQVFASPGPTRALPDAYELDSGLKEARGTLVLGSTDLATLLTGSLVIEATWEPNGPPDAETQRLIQEASLTSVGNAPTISNTS